MSELRISARMLGGALALALSLVPRALYADEPEATPGSPATPEPIRFDLTEGLAPSAAPELDPEHAWRERRVLLHNSWEGAVGGFRVVDAGSGQPGTFRVLLGGMANASGDFLGTGESNTRIGNIIAVAYTPLESLELFSYATVWNDSAYGVDRSLFQVLGDFHLGIKAYHRVLPWLTLGGDAVIRFPFNTARDTGRVLEATSFGPRFNATADLRELEGHEGRIPVIARFNAGYFFDRSAALVKDLEAERYGELPTDGPDARRPFEEESRHRISAFERFALQVNRTDRVRLGTGFEVPLTVEDWSTTISPVLEWVLDVPVNRQGFVCPEAPALGPVERCLRDVGIQAYPQSLVLGVKVMPVLRGISIFTAFELGVTGTSLTAHEIAPQEPYRILFGFSYTHDPAQQPKEPKAPKEVADEPEADEERERAEGR